MLGPSSSPVLIALVNVGFFVGAGFLSYLVGKGDSKSKKYSPSI